jgi:hypothetical protein
VILLRDLKGTIRLDHTKDMSVRVFTYTNCDFNALMPVVLKFWRRKDVCVSTSRRENE